MTNTPSLQAVKHTGLDISQIVFYTSGEIEVSDGLTFASDSPGIFMLKMDVGGLSEISISDPNRELRKMHFSVSTRIEREGDNYNVNWIENESISEFSIDLPQGVYAGKSVTVIL